MPGVDGAGEGGAVRPIGSGVATTPSVALGEVAGAAATRDAVGGAVDRVGNGVGAGAFSLSGCTVGYVSPGDRIESPGDRFEDLRPDVKKWDIILPHIQEHIHTDARLLQLTRNKYQLRKKLRVMFYILPKIYTIYIYIIQHYVGRVPVAGFN